MPTTAHRASARRTRRAGCLVLTLVAGGLAGATARPALGAAPGPVGFGPPVYVSTDLAGGEPEVLQSSRTGNLLYTAHEGTTHLLRDGVVGGFDSTLAMTTQYRNQVNMWTSKDAGASWQKVDYMRTGFFTDPTINTGFSDPDLTEDESGNAYNTGINLANDSLFSSQDGGFTWPKGTINCHNGDRPWLAGGKPDEVFLATDTVEGSVSGSGHSVFRSGDAGQTCAAGGVDDFGKVAGRTFSGFGKLYYDHNAGPANGSLVEPIILSDANGKTDGLGVSILPKGGTAFTPHIAVPSTTLSAHWPAIAIDRGDAIYLVWDTDDRSTTDKRGCGEGPTPLANSIMLTYSTDHGASWAAPVTVARPGTRVLWPWVQAGSAGDISVVWYQYDRVTDPDCGAGKVSVMDAHIFNATNPAARTTQIVNAAGRPVHDGGMCQGGTTCVATGQDRRLGDFFTNALDARGCVLIATGDTQRPDPATGGPQATSRPLYIAQTTGPSLTGQDCAVRPVSLPGGSAGGAAPSASAAPSSPSPSSTGGRSLATTGRGATPLVAAVVLLALAAVGFRLRRRRRHS